jgi:hypothetical protein
MGIAGASSEPLFERPRPSNAEIADICLRDLYTVTLEALP